MAEFADTLHSLIALARAHGGGGPQPWLVEYLADREQRGQVTTLPMVRAVAGPQHIDSLSALRRDPKFAVLDDHRAGRAGPRAATGR